MYIDPVAILVLLVLALVVRQVFYRVTRWFSTLVIFFLIMAVLMPHQTKGLLGGVFSLLREAFYRILYVLGWS